MGFPGGSADKESACNEGDLGLSPGLGRSPGEGNSLPTPVFLPGEFRGLYIHGVAKSHQNKQKKDKSKLGSNLDKRNKYKHLVKGLILIGVM